MIILVLCGVVLLASALVVLLPLPRGLRASQLGLAAALALVACAAGAVAAGHALATGAVDEVHAAWEVPFGSFALRCDALAALFLLPIFVLGGLGIVYGREYLASPGTDARDARRGVWAFYYAFIASMAVVVVAANAMLFLVAWEAMSVAAFFLVTYEDDDPAVRQAGWTFLIAAHIGTAFLLAMFLVLGRGAETLDFDQLAGGAESGRAAGAVVLLALAGFGTKAGLVPGHVWLPAAHPAAPSHVSAVLSGAMLNTGIYGLLRTLTLLPEIPPWTGWLLVAAGLVSGLFGIAFALAQHDLKRLLADSSIENLGVVTLGIGLGLIGVQHDLPAVAVLGFGGALLHVLNHALFKGLLFFAAGSMLHATGTRNLDELGGLLRRMPWTGNLFVLAAAAISALPPLNGFVGEFLIYLAAFEGLGAGDASIAVAALAAILGLALIGGLVAAAFLRAGLALVGLPRSEASRHAHDPGPSMRGAMLLLGAGCVLIGLVPSVALRAIEPAIEAVSRLEPAVVEAEVTTYASVLQRISLVAGLLVALVLGLAFLRSRLGRVRPVRSGPVWATAYAQPTARMQYSGASFVRPLTSLLQRVLQSRQLGGPPAGYFPSPERLSVVTPGLFRERVFLPAFAGVEWLALRLRWLQHGRIQLYLLNIAATLVILLVWKLGFGA